MAHSIANRLRKLAGNRRQVRRRRARRRAQLFVPVPAPGIQPTTNPSSPTSLFEGYTRDISIGGIALVIPSLNGPDGNIVREGAPVEITLELPASRVRMRAIPVRCESLDNSERGCLVAARIVAMNDGDRARLVDYLRRLSSSVSDFAPLL